MALTELAVTLGTAPEVTVSPASTDSAAVSANEPPWQVLEIPIDGSAVDPRITSLTLTGKGMGTLYLDDIRFVAIAPSPVPGTAVADGWVGSTPATASPNPFNPSASVRYDLAQAADVRLSIYSVTGQRVRQLVAERQAAGTYAALWDGRDTGGVAVGSGLYLCELVAGDFRAVRRVALVR